ncbi:ABC transporter permease [Nocardioides sp. MH1]|uniref:ABC transporter permease n=1 Tax=Nocardioides sp. MH1 TaxID=3242490 RepID=UPI00352227FD
MTRTVRVYWRILVAGFRRQSAYVMAAFGGLVANTTFGLLKVAILFATVRAAGGELEGYDVALMSTYIWISQGLLGSINMSGRIEIADRIKSGDVAVDFLRPLDVQGAAITTEVGRAVFNLIPRGLPSVLIGGIFVGMALPADPSAYALGAVSVLLAIAVSAATVYLLVGVPGFWIVETRGLQILYMVVSGFLAGLFVPIWLFPDVLEVAAQATPFPATMMYPVDVISGRAAGLDAVALVAAQVAWLLGVLAVGQLLTRAGRRHLEVQGG